MDVQTELVAQCLQGDRAAWVSLYQDHAPVAARMLNHLLGPVPDMEDLVQQVFVCLVSSLPRLRQNVRLSTWIYGIAINVAQGHLRGEKRLFRRQAAYADWISTKSSMSWNPADGVEARRYLDLLDTVLQRMSFKSRAVWVMHELEDVTSEDIAASLGVPAVTVRVRLLRARREVTKALLDAGLNREILGLGGSRSPSGGLEQ
jgi:RNA polymerase sigma-70 factor (ECF subfamily)